MQKQSPMMAGVSVGPHAKGAVEVELSNLKTVYILYPEVLRELVWVHCAVRQLACRWRWLGNGAIFGKGKRLGVFRAAQ